MKRIETGDRSETLYSAIYNESYHSRSGALRESFNKYCIPCGIGDLACNGAMTVLDIGFGLGYNLLATIYMAKEANSECRINVISMEKDLLPIGLLKGLNMPAAYSNLYEALLHAAKDGHYCRDGMTIDILRGDARDQIRSVDASFDAVFLDPFSVKNNPELWTVDFFKEIYPKMKENALLATYSASTPVRTGLLEAGFYIGEGPGDEMKRGGTIASKSPEKVYMCPEKLDRIKNSPERIPFYDPSLNFTARQIFSYREELKRKQTS